MSSQQDPAAYDQLSARKRPMTSAEKQRNYRERLKQSPEKYEIFKQREAERQRERTKTRKQTEEEVVQQRMKWRERVRKHRLKKKQEALMNETQFQDTFYMSEGSTSSSVMPQVFDGSEELATAMSLDPNSYRDIEYSQANTNSCPEMNLSDMNIGQYIMDVHNDHNRGGSSNNAMKLECNTPEGDDNSTHEIDVEAKNYFLAQQYAHVASENGFGVGQIQVNDDGNLANVEQMPIQLQTGRTVLSLVDGFCGEPPEKERRKPLTPAERQRNYRARLKAQPGKWEQYRSRDTERRQRMEEQDKEIVSERKKIEYQRRKRVKGGSNTRSKMKDTGQDDGCSLPGAPSYAEGFSSTVSTEEATTAIDCIQPNADSHLDLNLSEVKVEQCDLDPHSASEDRGTCEDNMVNFTPDTSDNYSNSTVEVGDSFYAGKLVEASGEYGFGVGQSPVYVRGRQTSVAEMQDHMLSSSSILVLDESSHKPPQKKKWPLTPAERQRNYRERRKAQQEMIQKQNVEELQNQLLEGPSALSLVRGSPEKLPQKKWPLTPAERQRNYRARRKAQQEKMQKQKKMAEEAASRRRRKATERQREYRRRKKDPGDFPSASNAEAVTLTNEFNQSYCSSIDYVQANTDSHLDMNLSQLKLQQCDLVTDTSDRGKCQNDALNVKVECITPDVGGNDRNTTVELQGYCHAESYGEMANEIERGVSQSAECGDGSLTNIEDMQTRLLLEVPSVLSLVGDSPGSLPQKEWPLTPAERQRNYRARRKAQQEIMQKHQMLEGPSVLSLVEDSPGRLPQKKWPLTPAERQRNYRARRKAQQEMMQMQKKMTEEAASQRRRKATERQREYRCRKKDPGDFSSTRNTEAVPLATRFSPSNCRRLGYVQANTDSHVDMNLSQLKLPQGDLDTDPSDKDECTNDVVNVKLEPITPDVGDIHTGSNMNVEVRDNFHAERYGEVTSEIECGVGQSAVRGDGSLTNAEEMQNQLLAGPPVSSLIGGSPGRSSKKRSPLTPAERQQQYRARLKAQPDKWEQYKSRDSERRKSVQELKKLSEAAAALRREKAKERKRAYRHRKREKEESSTMSKMKDTGQANMWPFSGEASNPVDNSFTRTTGRTDKIRATRLNQNRYRSSDYLKTNTDSNLDMNSAEMKIGQYVMDARVPSKKFEKTKCNTPDGDDNSTYLVNLEAINCFPAQQSVQVTSENGLGVVQIQVNGVVDRSQFLTCPSGSSLVEGVRRRYPRRRRPMTAAERQRKYRARIRAQAEKREQQGSRDTERPRNIQEETTISEDAASQLRKMAKERKGIHLLRKRGIGGLNTRKNRDTGQADVCPISVDSCTSRTMRSSTAERRPHTRRDKYQQTIGVGMKTEQRDDGRCPSTERHKQQKEAELSYKRMKGRDRMRKFRLKQKQKSKNAYQGFSESDMPKITAVWSVSEVDKLRAQMEQEQFCGKSHGENTQYLPSHFGNSASVCNLSNMPKTNTRIADNLAAIVQRDDMGSLYGFDSSPPIVYRRGSANTLDYSDVPTALATPTPQPNHSKEQQRRGTFEGNVFPFKTNKMTSSERQKKYRERLQHNPEKWAAYKQKATERYLARKDVMTMKQVDKHRKQSLLRTRLWRARMKEGKNSKDIALNDAFQDVISEEETQMLHLSFHDEKNKHSGITENIAGSKRTNSMGQSGKRRYNKSPEEMERLRQANRERQRRHRAKKRWELEESMQSTSSFAVTTNHPVLADNRLTNGVERSESSEYSTQFRICPNLSSLEHVSPRKQGRPQIPRKFIEQPTPQVRKKRGRPQKHSPLKTEQCTDDVINDAIVSPLGNECHREVLVSSAGNIPMVIKTPQLKGQREPRWEEIPQVIPCDPPEADFDWGNVELDHFQSDLDGVASMVIVEVTEPVPGAVEGGIVSGSARRKAFFPTKHDTADLTLNAAWAVETPLGDP